MESHRMRCAVEHVAQVVVSVGRMILERPRPAELFSDNNDRDDVTLVAENLGSLGGATRNKVPEVFFRGPDAL